MGSNIHKRTSLPGITLEIGIARDRSFSSPHPLPQAPYKYGQPTYFMVGVYRIAYLVLCVVSLYRTTVRHQICPQTLVSPETLHTAPRVLLPDRGPRGRLTSILCFSDILLLPEDSLLNIAPNW